MATVNKNFVVKNGLVVQGSTATVNGNNILTESNGDSYILNLVGGATLVKSVDSVFTVDGSGNLTFNYGTGLTKSGNNLVIDRSTVDTWYDAAGAAATAESNANSYTDNAASTAQSNAESYADNQISSAISTLSGQTSTDIADAIATAEGYADSAAAGAQQAAENYADGVAATAQSNAQSYADTVSATAQSNANAYTDSAISNEVTNRNNAIATALSTAESYTDTAVSNLVDSAPALLDTLNELAAAIADNPNYATDVANLVATKADTTYVDTQDAATLSSANSYTDSAISTEVTNRDNAISTALSSAETYADNLVVSGNSNAEPTYKGVNIGSYTELVSGWNSTSDGSAFVPLSWNTNYGTAKLTVHVRSGVHTQASEVLIARDSSNNIHITEFAMITTNGQLADISATVAGSIVSLTVTPTAGHNQTEAVASGSVMIWAD